jgi:hypothetical protein
MPNSGAKRFIYYVELGRINRSDVLKNARIRQVPDSGEVLLTATPHTNMHEYQT